MPLSEDEKARIDVSYFETSKGLTHRRPPALMHQSTNAMVPLVINSSVSDQSPSSSSSTLERRHVINMSSSPKVEMNGFAQFSNVNATLDNANNNRVEQNGYANSVFFTNEDLLDNCFSNEQTVDTEIRNAAMNDDSNSVGSTANDRAPLLPDGDHYELTNLSTAPVLDKNISVAHAKSLPHTEGACTIGVQVFIPFLIAGFGTVGAGLVLDIVQHWRVFTEVTQIFILVPALLGLKGNLEMTLASRMSTLAHLGLMDTKSERMKQIISNLALIQVQAAVVAFLAAVFAVILGWVPKGAFSWDNTFLLCASSLATASMASFILGSIMVLVVILSRHFHINPDNVATPIAASLGDLTTLSLLATVGTLLNRCKDSEFWVSPMVICFFIMLCPLWIWMSLRNPVTREVLISGWSPVIFSMLISSAGGFILEYTVARFRGIAVFQPVINGIGGNLVAVQASRLSTSLHKSSRLGVLPAESPKTCVNPCETFCGKQVSSVAARVLLALVVPGHLIFMYTINFLRAGHTTISLVFVIVYLTAAVIQVALLLYICHWMVHSMWKRKVDPDNSAIPYLTALGDLLGTALLAIAFQILYRIGDHDADLGE